MKHEQVLITGGETAFFLACALGPCQNWEGLLNDFRQGRRDFGCAPLMPVARAKRGNRAAVPRYRPLDVRIFIDAVRTLHGTDKPFPFVPRTFIIDDDDPSGYWFTRTATLAATVKVSP